MSEKKAVSPSAKKVTKKIEEVEFSSYPVKSYSEEYQVTGFHYAFMSANKEMCHHWVKCRDFLQDALRNQLTGRTDHIYNFSYAPGKDPKIETKKTLMLVKKTPCPADDKAKSEFSLQMGSALALVNHYEKAHKLTPRSKLIRAKQGGLDESVYLFRGPGAWSQGAVMIAIYTFLIRLGYFKLVFKDEESLSAEYQRIMSGPDNSNDIRYLRIVHKNLHLALEHRAKHMFKPKGWKKGNKVLFHDSTIGNFHHCSGIVSLSKFNTPVEELNSEFRKIFSAKK